MTFNKEIYNILTTNPEITDLVDGIFFNHLPDNRRATFNDIVYETFISEAMHTIPLENYGDEYTLSIKAVSQDPEKALEIGQAVKDFLRQMTETTNIRSIAFQRDVTVYDEEDNIHILNMDFIIDYCNT